MTGETTVVRHPVTVTRRSVDGGRMGSRFHNLPSTYFAQSGTSAFGRTVGATPLYEDRSTRERRSARRYPLDLTIQFELGYGGTETSAGQGRVVNISSSGVLLTTDQVLSPGMKIRLRIEWPARLNQVVPLALHVEGRTVRANGNLAAVRILRSEFRTRPGAQAAGTTGRAR